MPKTPEPRWFAPRSCYRFTVAGRAYYRRTKSAAYQLIDHLVKPRRNQRIDYVAEAVSAYSNLHPQREDFLKPFLNTCKFKLLHEVTGDDLARLAKQLRTAGKSDWTVRNYVSSAHALLKWCVEGGHLEIVPPRPRLPMPSPNPRPIELGLLHRILAALDNRNRKLARNVLVFRLETGARPGEACNLRWEWFDPSVGKFGVVRIPPADHKTGAKTGRDRVLYLNAAARALIDAQKRSGPFVFASRLGRPYTVSGLRSVWQSAVREVDPTLKLRPYLLRHMFAFQMRRQGVAVDTLAKLLGHRKLSTTGYYFQAEDAAALGAVEMAVSLKPARPVRAARGRKSAPSPPPPSRETPPDLPDRPASAIDP